MSALNHGTSKNVLTLRQIGSHVRGVKLSVEESDSNYNVRFEVPAAAKFCSINKM